MDVKKLIEGHKEAGKKTMEQLIEERNQKYAERHNRLRKKWLPERYDPSIDDKK